jgi:hypothetical protein
MRRRATNAAKDPRLPEPPFSQMTVGTKILNSKSVVWRMFGVCTGPELLEAAETLYGDTSRSEAWVRQLRDYRNADAVSWNAAELKALALHDRAASTACGPMWIAIVAPQDYVFGMFRIWLAHVQTPRIEAMVFRDADAAEQWLDSRRNAAD